MKHSAVGISRPRGARFAAILGAIFGASLLSGCASQSGGAEDRVGSFMVSPGKYSLYTCAHLAAQTVALGARERELDALIARAGPDAGGRFVSAIAYRPEYMQTRGNLIEVRKTETAKDCPPAAAAAPPVVDRKPRRR